MVFKPTETPISSAAQRLGSTFSVSSSAVSRARPSHEGSPSFPTEVRGTRLPVRVEGPPTPSPRILSMDPTPLPSEVESNRSLYRPGPVSGCWGPLTAPWLLHLLPPQLLFQLLEPMPSSTGMLFHPVSKVALSSSVPVHEQLLACKS